VQNPNAKSGLKQMGVCVVGVSTSLKRGVYERVVKSHRGGIAISIAISATGNFFL
jgi:hypothetical protein